jgi:hypothetical protein
LVARPGARPFATTNKLPPKIAASPLINIGQIVNLSNLRIGNQHGRQPFSAGQSLLRASRLWLVMAMTFVLIASLAQSAAAASPFVAGDVQTNESSRNMFVSGLFTINGTAPLVGSEWAAFDQSGTICAYYIVTLADLATGAEIYGADAGAVFTYVNVWGEDGDPLLDEGPLEGEQVEFRVYDAATDTVATGGNLSFADNTSGYFPLHFPSPLPPVFEGSRLSYGMDINATTCLDSDSDTICDDADICPGFDDLVDTDNDTVPDGCDLCAGDNASGDTDGDLSCNDQDLDDDNDGVVDTVDSDPLNAFICADGDGDFCDDCAVTGADNSGGNISFDGPDYDGDSICDAGDSDDDNDGVADTVDSDPLNEFVCADTDNDSCDDCAVTGADNSGGDVNNDGADYDLDGICDAGDLDDDKDGVPDTNDTAPRNEFVCADTDNDSCDDCAVTGADGSGGDVSNDGPDADNDGICDTTDICTGADATGDTDGDGVCNDIDTDDDGDGVADTDDSAPLNAFICADADNDGCDDCAVTGADGSGGDVSNDGPDADTDSICDAGDPDNDNDGVANTSDSAPLNAFICADADNDGCDDCAITGADGSGGDIYNDGIDTDGDTICDTGDAYPENANLAYPGIKSSESPPSSNIDEISDKPKVEKEFTFSVTVDHSDAASVWLVLNEQPIKMDCGAAPNITDPAGAPCSLSLRLGPAPAYNYHYEVWDSADQSGTMLVNSFDSAGPDVYLLHGPNMVGLPRDVSGGASAFLDSIGADSVFRWQSGGLKDKYNKGEFVLLDDTTPQTPGEGYFMVGESVNQKLPDPGIADIAEPTVTMVLQPGWNIISNPYAKPIPLRDLEIQKDDTTPVSWTDAATVNWVLNAIYYFKGSDWGSQYAHEYAGGTPDAVLTPWLGYWLYLMLDDGATYKLIFSKP